MSENQNTPIPVRIRNAEDLAIGVKHLIEIDPSIIPIIDRLDEVPLRLRPAGFQGMAEIVVAQQVSKASANAMFSRLLKLISPLDAANVLAAGEAPLIEAGLSRAKQTTLAGLATAITEESLDLECLCILPVDEATERLTALRGIGPWTAQVFLLFCAGHADIFPAGDVALQHAAGEVLGLPSKPDQKLTAELAVRWAPLRGVAARVLYAEYARKRTRKDLPV